MVVAGPKLWGAHLATYSTLGLLGAATTSSVSQVTSAPLTVVGTTMLVIVAVQPPVQAVALGISEMPPPSARYSEVVAEPSLALAKARPVVPLASRSVLVPMYWAVGA